MAKDNATKTGSKTDAGPKNRSGQVQSLTRSLSILNVIAQNGTGLTLTGIATVLTLAPSTTHRLLTTLQNERYVRFDGERNLWKIGVQAFVVGNEFLRSRDLVSMARPYMENLVETSGETVNLAVTNEGKAIYLAQVESPQMMRALAKPGAQVFMHCSAVGKALLAQMADKDVGKIVSSRGLPKFTENTLDTPPRLRSDLAAVRAAGYALDDEEHALGLRCIAAPIFNEFSQPVAAVSLSGPMVRIPDDSLGKLGVMVAQTAAQITAAMGGK